MQEHITKPKKSLYEPKSPPQNTLLNDLIVLLALQTAAATGKERVWGHFESSVGGKDSSRQSLINCFIFSSCDHCDQRCLYEFSLLHCVSLGNLTVICSPPSVRQRVKEIFVFIIHSLENSTCNTMYVKIIRFINLSFTQWCSLLFPELRWTSNRCQRKENWIQ